MLQKKCVGRNISAYRKKRGMTQKELADVLHVSYQSVSKWESGGSLPTVEMLYGIAKALGATTDMLLSEKSNENKIISYADTGLDTLRLYDLKAQIVEMATKDERLLAAPYTMPALFQADITAMKDPIFGLMTCVPGSKARFARERGYDREISADVVARAINSAVEVGMKPLILQGHMVCGSNNNEQIRNIAESLKTICEENGVLFAGMEIAAQPVNYRSNEYDLYVGIVSVGDKEKLLDGKHIKEGDLLIAIKTEGIDCTNYPIIKVMMDRNPDMVHQKVDEHTWFVEAILRPNTAYGCVINELMEKNLIHGAFRTRDNIGNSGLYERIPYGLGAVIDFNKVQETPLYGFLTRQNMIGSKVLHWHFNFGVGMLVAVAPKDCEKAMEIIQKYHDCYVIGKIEKNAAKEKDEKVRMVGNIPWS